MRSRVGIFAAVAILLLTIGARTFAAEKPATYRIRKPTIIAFFPPLTDKELDDDPDASDELDDFQDSADAVRDPLRRAGVDFIEVYTRSFTMIVDGKTIVFRSGKDRDVGYYFLAPGRKPHVEYGVEDDDDILDDAQTYLGVRTRSGNSRLRTARATISPRIKNAPSS